MIPKAASFDELQVGLQSAKHCRQLFRGHHIQEAVCGCRKSGCGSGAEGVGIRALAGIGSEKSCSKSCSAAWRIRFAHHRVRTLRPAATSRVEGRSASAHLEGGAATFARGSAHLSERFHEGFERHTATAMRVVLPGRSRCHRRPVGCRRVHQLRLTVAGGRACSRRTA
eukprot:scaffold106584_cov31-Tisochrysis_lutea.AAC.2